MKITKGFASIMSNDAPSSNVWLCDGPNRVPVVILTTANFERIVAALRPFAAQSPMAHGRWQHAIIGPEDLNAAAEIVKEIEG